MKKQIIIPMGTKFNFLDVIKNEDIKMAYEKTENLDDILEKLWSVALNRIPLENSLRGITDEEEEYISKFKLVI